MADGVCRDVVERERRLSGWIDDIARSRRSDHACAAVFGG